MRALQKLLNIFYKKDLHLAEYVENALRDPILSTDQFLAKWKNPHKRQVGALLYLQMNAVMVHDEIPTWYSGIRLVVLRSQKVKPTSLWLKANQDQAYRFATEYWTEVGEKDLLDIVKSDESIHFFKKFTPKELAYYKFLHG